MKFPTTKLLIILALFALVKNDDDDNLNKDIPKYSTIKVQYGNHTINRPLFHFTPKFGWMNDPNGCWYDKKDKVYHIYYQYNPNDTIWGMPLYWGHASSKDLSNWTHHEIAIRAPDWAGAYSGSMFIDDECVATGWFPHDTKCNDDNKYKNTIAAWTWNDKYWYEYQCLSYSTDGGEKFITEKDYCALIIEKDKKIVDGEEKEVNSTQFRDPQVVKFGSRQFIMSIAKSHEYSIHFYESTDLAKWTLAGGFTLYGYLGFQYECPNLIKLKNNDKIGTEADSYWVLFISINPGSQQGGSSTEYFFGQYTFGTDQNVNPYVASFNYNTLMDQGKDFYAMQIMYVPPETNELTGGFDTGIGITWASNWQYTKVVPTDPWRSSMAIPRRIKLGHYNPTGSTPLLYVLSKAILDDNDMNDANPATSTRFDEPLPTDYTTITKSGDVYTIPGTAFGALELYIEFVSCDAYTDHAPGVITFFLRGGTIPEEYLRIGYNQKADAFFLDRGNTRVQWVHDNPFFTDKLTMTVYGTGLDTEQTGIFKTIYEEGTGYDVEYSGKCSEVKFTAHIIVDRNIVEVFFNEDGQGYSAITSTNTFFFSGGNFITDVLVDYNSGQTNTDAVVGFRDIKIKGRHLNLKESSSDNSETPSEETPDPSP